jgi:hypothetical protein
MRETFIYELDWSFFTCGIDDRGFLLWDKKLSKIPQAR